MTIHIAGKKLKFVNFK